MITDAMTAAVRTATITNKPDIRRTKGNLTWVVMSGFGSRSESHSEFGGDVTE